MSIEQIEHDYKYHPPEKSQIEKYTRLRVYAKNFALLIHELCPDSPHSREAYKLLHRTLMEANASIALKKKE